MASVSQSSIDKVLSKSILAWFGLVFLGQLLFATYIIVFYGSGIVLGDLQRWNEGAPHAYAQGDFVGNVTFGIHVLIAAMISLIGPIQLIPSIRTKAPKLHRISGRIYLIFAIIISFAGLYLSWVKGSVGGIVNSIFVSINALIIMYCAYQSYLNAVGRNIPKHKFWSIGLFLSMCGVWFFRVCLMFWILINGGVVVGFDSETFTGPALVVIDIICYVLPLLILVLITKAIKSSQRSNKIGAVVFMLFLFCATTLGLFGATMGMWIPSIF